MKFQLNTIYNLWICFELSKWREELTPPPSNYEEDEHTTLHYATLHYNLVNCYYFHIII